MRATYFTFRFLSVFPNALFCSFFTPWSHLIFISFRLVTEHTLVILHCKTIINTSPYTKPLRLILLWDFITRPAKHFDHKCVLVWVIKRLEMCREQHCSNGCANSASEAEKPHHVTIQFVFHSPITFMLGFPPSQTKKRLSVLRLNAAVPN